MFFPPFVSRIIISGFPLFFFWVARIFSSPCCWAVPVILSDAHLVVGQMVVRWGGWLPTWRMVDMKMIRYHGKPMVNSPLIRPYLLGGVALGGVP